MDRRGGSSRESQAHLPCHAGQTISRKFDKFGFRGIELGIGNTEFDECRFAIFELTDFELTDFKFIYFGFFVLGCRCQAG